MKEEIKIKNMIRKLVSGGQTGADKGALIAAYDCGIATGGYAPKGWKTEKGPDLSLLTKFKLTESDSVDYEVRTLKNVKTTDCTVIISDKKSKGSALTEKRCAENNKPVLVVSSSDFDDKTMGLMIDFIRRIYLKKNRPLFVNFAGNRESKAPGIEKRVSDLMKLILEFKI